MLSAFEQHLKHLALDFENEFHDEIRSRVGKKATLTLENRLKSLILLLPKLLSSIINYCDHKTIPFEQKKSIAFMLTFLFQPRGFLYNENKRLIQYLDDAYFAALIYEKVLCQIEKIETLTDFDQNFLKQMSRIKRSVKALIPNEVEKIVQMVDAIMNSNQELFYSAFV